MQAYSRLQLIEECGIRFRIIERLSRRIDRGDAPLRDQDPERRFRVVELGRDPSREPAILLGRGSHERHLGVVDMEPAVLEPFGHGRQGAEVDHVERAEAQDEGDLGPDGWIRSDAGRPARCRRPPRRPPRSS